MSNSQNLEITVATRQGIDHVDADQSKENNDLPLIEVCMTEGQI